MESMLRYILQENMLKSYPLRRMVLNEIFFGLHHKTKQKGIEVQQLKLVHHIFPDYNLYLNQF